jgi:hypothetical protein
MVELINFSPTKCNGTHTVFDFLNKIFTSNKLQTVAEFIKNIHYFLNTVGCFLFFANWGGIHKLFL